MALDAADDRAAYALPVLGDQLGIEPDAAVLDEDRRLAVLDLGIERHAVTPECLAALTSASRAAATAAASASFSSASPTVTMSTDTAYASSTSAATVRNSVPNCPDAVRCP